MQTLLKEKTAKRVAMAAYYETIETTYDI